MRRAIIQAVLLGIVCAAHGCGPDAAEPSARESATDRAPLGDAGYQTWCNPPCEGALHCEFLLQDCEAESCPWIPSCVEGIDPCATVSCPGVCAVGSDHRHRCVKLP